MFTENFDITNIKDTRLELPRFQGEYLINNQKLMHSLGEFAYGKNINTAQLALAWLLDKGDNIIPIPGTKKRKYLEQNAQAVDVVLSANEVAEIEGVIAQFPDTGERYNSESMKLVNH